MNVAPSSVTRILESVLATGGDQVYQPAVPDPLPLHGFLIGAGLALLGFMIPVLYRVTVGPTAIDRIVAINIIGTKTAVLLVIIGTIFGKVEMFVDFALAYALLNFIGSLAAARFIHRQKQERDAAAAENLTTENAP